MKPSEVLKQLEELREQVKHQAFKFTTEQQAEYDRLIALRRERVKFFYKEGKSIRVLLQLRKQLKLLNN